MAAPLVLAASGCGLVIAVVDALHDVTRSRVIAIAFAVAAVASGFSAVQSVGVRLWERRVLRDAEAPLDLGTPLPPPHRARSRTPSRDDAVASADRR